MSPHESILIQKEKPFIKIKMHKKAKVLCRLKTFQISNANMKIQLLRKLKYYLRRNRKKWLKITEKPQVITKKLLWKNMGSRYFSVPIRFIVIVFYYVYCVFYSIPISKSYLIWQKRNSMDKRAQGQV